MSLAAFGVASDGTDTDGPRYEFEAQAEPWTLVEPTLDESVTPAKTQCPGCGTNAGAIEPVLLDYGREDGLLLACRLCQDCKHASPSHTVGKEDARE